MALTKPKKTILTFLWFFITPIVLTTSLYTALKLHTSPPTYLHQIPNITLPDTTIPTSDSTPGEVKGLSTTIQTDDARPVIIAEFLKKHGSPLEPYNHFGQFLTDLADKYQIDFRLLPAIAMQESNLCKKIPADSYNCLGLGVHSQGTWEFNSFEENFDAAAQVLRDKYLNQGLITPEEIQSKYTPNSNGSWQYAVNHFMEILETADF